MLYRDVPMPRAHDRMDAGGRATQGAVAEYAQERPAFVLPLDEKPAVPTFPYRIAEDCSWVRSTHQGRCAQRTLHPGIKGLWKSMFAREMARTRSHAARRLAAGGNQRRQARTCRTVFDDSSRLLYAFIQRGRQPGNIDGGASIEQHDVARRAGGVVEHRAHHIKALLRTRDRECFDVGALQAELLRPDAVGT